MPGGLAIPPGGPAGLGMPPPPNIGAGAPAGLGAVKDGTGAAAGFGAVKDGAATGLGGVKDGAATGLGAVKDGAATGAGAGAGLLARNDGAGAAASLGAVKDGAATGAGAGASAGTGPVGLVGWEAAILGKLILGAFLVLFLGATAGVDSTRGGAKGWGATAKGSSDSLIGAGGVTGVLGAGTGAGATAAAGPFLPPGPNCTGPKPAFRSGILLAAGTGAFTDLTPGREADFLMPPGRAVTTSAGLGPAAGAVTLALDLVGAAAGIPRGIG